jgi:hypothetical protein
VPGGGTRMSMQLPTIPPPADAPDEGPFTSS